MLTKKQIRQRAGKIGASEAATALGYFGSRVSSTPFQYVLRKIGDQLPPDFVAKYAVKDTRPTTPLLRGTMMENSVMRLFKAKHKDWYIRRLPDNQTLQHQTVEWMVATPDGVILDKDNRLWIAEYKTMSTYRFRNLAEELVSLDDDINVIKNQVRVNLPISIQMQGAQTINVARSYLDSPDYIGSPLHQALAPKIGDAIPELGGVVFFYILIGNGEVYYDDPIEIIWHYDDNAKNFIFELERELDTFWHTYMDKPDLEAILSLRNATDYSGAVPVEKSAAEVSDTMEFDDNTLSVRDVIEKIKGLKDAGKKIEEQVSYLESAIKEWIGDKEELLLNGDCLATWKRQNGGWTINADTAKKILKEHPEYGGMIKQSTFRRLNIK